MAAREAAPGQVSPRPGRAEPRPPGRPALSDRLPRGWLFPLLVFALTWVVILATWSGADAVYGQSHPWTWHFIFKDSVYYLGIAEHGYPGRLPSPWNGSPIAARAAFFPVFPLLIRFISYLTGGDYLAAGLVASVLAGAASAVGVWALAARLRGRRVADRAVLLYCFFPGAMTFGMLYSEPLAVALFFPGAMTFGMLYSEPLAVALGAAALLALVERRWLLAGLAGAAGAAERPTLILLTAVAAAAAAQAIWTRREWRALLAPALTPSVPGVLRLSRAPVPRLRVLVPGGTRGLA